MASAFRPHFSSAVAFIAFGLTACGGEEDETPASIDSGLGVPAFDGGTIPQADSAVVGIPDGASGAATLPCDVQTVFDKHCKTCHVAAGLGGFPLSTLADLRAPSKSSPTKPTYTAVVEHMTATAGGAVTVMPPAGYERPTASEIASVTAWVNAGANAGASCTAGAPGDGGTPVGDGGQVADGGGGTDDPNAPIDTTGLTCYKLLAHQNGNLNSKFKVGVATDAYFNMTFAAPWQGTAYASVIRPITDNTQAIHHWLLFKDGSAGNAGAVASSSGAHPAGELLYGWAPGGSSFDFRAAGDTGYALPGNTTYTMEYHYNSKEASAEDASGVEICVTSTKPANLVTQSWLGIDNLSPSTTWTGTCVPASSQRIHIIGVSPHMHLKGRHMKGIINRKDGSKETLHDLDFDFEYQRMYKKDVWLEPGDTITTTCTYASPSAFGKATTDEMCYLFTMAYPGGALTDNGIAGRIAHGANACLGGGF